jgi:hypothetical protein
MDDQRYIGIAATTTGIIIIIIATCNDTIIIGTSDASSVGAKSIIAIRTIIGHVTRHAWYFCAVNW